LANKRMFNKQVISTDEFLDMPLSSQALYFHLAINADDDGFVAPKSIMRLVQANGDDLKILISKNFLIPFDDKVVVVTHWRLHNKIQSDRYTETEFQIYKSQIICDVSKMYTKCIPDKNRLDKISIGKIRREELIEQGFKKYLNSKDN
jgi:hypothetical protein